MNRLSSPLDSIIKDPEQREAAWKVIEEKIELHLRAGGKRSPIFYFAKSHHRNTRGEKLRFGSRTYLKELYKEAHRAKEIRIMKSVQMGITEFLVASAFYFAGEEGWSVFYVLPSQPLRNKFVANRVDKVVRFSEKYERLIKNAVGRSDSVGLKHVGKGTMIFVGSNTITEFKETPADILVIDELDQCDPDNIPFAKDRLQASPHKFQWIVGNPTVGSFGIAKAYYEESDQREWMVRCPHCGELQPLDWFKNVVVNIGSAEEPEYELRDKEWSRELERDIKVLCRKCGKPLNRLAPGEWVPLNPKSKIRGYHVNHLASPTVTVREMWEDFQEAQFNETKLQVFYNSGLGLPYTAAGMKLTDSVLNRLKGEYLPWQGAEEKHECVLGCDPGRLLHTVITALVDGEEKVVWWGALRKFEELDDLMKRFKVKMAVIEAEPEVRKAQEFADKWKGRAFRSHYPPAGTIREMQVDLKERLVKIDRTASLDALVSDIFSKRIRLPANADTWDRGEFYRMMTSSTRVFNEAKGRYIWIEDGPDHYFHAFNFNRIARALVPRGKGRFIGPGKTVPMESTSRKPEEYAEEAAKEKIRESFQATSVPVKPIPKAVCASCKYFKPKDEKKGICTARGLATYANNPACPFYKERK